MPTQLLTFGNNLRVMPCFHHRIPFSIYTAHALSQDDWNPDVVAIELSPSIGKAVWQGLQRLSAGPLWVGKKVEDELERLPPGSLSGFQHTVEACEATARVILDGRRHAHDTFGLIPDCPVADWLARPEHGFEPVLLVPGDDRVASPTYHCNVILPDRIYDASEAYGGVREKTGVGVWNTRLSGRVWYVPPFYSGGGAIQRRLWIKQGGHEDRAPRVRSRDQYNCDEPWLHRLMRRAIEYCSSHVIYIAPADMRPFEDLVELAASEGRRVIHVPSEVLDAKAFAYVANDEFEFDPFDRFEHLEPTMEAYALNSGDAFIAALDYAKATGREVAWVDREIVDPLELELADQRPRLAARNSLDDIEDVFLSEEGVPHFYERVRREVEATRVEAVDAPRERRMASHIKRLIGENKKVLLLCGAAHWGEIRRLLEDPSFTEPLEDPPTEPAQLLCAGPYDWVQGGGEIPRVVGAFERARQAGRAADFDCARATQDTLARTLRALGREGAPVSEIKSFETYLRRFCTYVGVMVPRLYHFTMAAEACLDAKSRKVVLRQLMRSRTACPDGVPRISSVRSDPDGDLTAKVGRDVLKIRSRSGSGNAGRVSLDRPQERTPQGIEDPGIEDPGIEGPWIEGPGIEGPDEAPPTSGGTEFSYRDWEAHLVHMVLLVRKMARQRVRVYESAPVQGGDARRIDARATVRARARGERGAYQRRELSSRFNSRNEFEDFDPVVWLFDYEITGHINSLIIDPDRPDDDRIAGVCAAERKGRGPLGHEYYYSMLATWVPRFADSDSTMRERLLRWVRQGNRRYVPTKTQFDELVRSPSQVYENVLGLAASCSRSQVIVVAGKRPGLDIGTVFSRKGRRLLFVDLASFDPDDIQRLRMPIYHRGRIDPG